MKVFIFLIRMKVFHLTVLTSYVFIKVNLLILSLWYIFSCCFIGTFFAVSKLTKYWYQISKLVLLLRKDVNNDPKNTAANSFLKIFVSTKNRKILCYWSLEEKERILYAFLRPILFKKQFCLSSRWNYGILWPKYFILEATGSDSHFTYSSLDV